VNNIFISEENGSTAFNSWENSWELQWANLCAPEDRNPSKLNPSIRLRGSREKQAHRR